MTEQTTPEPVEPAVRSDNLLPADGDDDGRYDVAEEMNLDVQSDNSRKVGQIADDASAQALAESIEEKSQAGM